MTSFRRLRAGTLVAFLVLAALAPLTPDPAAVGGEKEKLFVDKPLTAARSFTPGIEGPALPA